jgi:hypothetical protein
MADCGNFAAIKTRPDTVKSLTLATVYGLCTQVAERKSPDKLSIYRALMGNFRIIPAEGDPLETGLLIFPPAFLALLTAQIKALEENAVAQLRFAYDVVSVRAKNEAGYSINFVVRAEPTVANPMDDFVTTNSKKK